MFYRHQALATVSAKFVTSVRKAIGCEIELDIHSREALVVQYEGPALIVEMMTRSI